MQQITVIYKAYHYFKLLARLNTIAGFTSFQVNVLTKQGFELQLFLLPWQLAYLAINYLVFAGCVSQVLASCNIL